MNWGTASRLRWSFSSLLWYLHSQLGCRSVCSRLSVQRRQSIGYPVSSASCSCRSHLFIWAFCLSLSASSGSIGPAAVWHGLCALLRRSLDQSSAVFLPRSCTSARRVCDTDAAHPLRDVGGHAQRLHPDGLVQGAARARRGL